MCSSDSDQLIDVGDDNATHPQRMDGNQSETIRDECLVESAIEDFPVDIFTGLCEKNNSINAEKKTKFGFNLNSAI